MSDFTEGVLRMVDEGLKGPDPRLITIGCVMTNQARKDWGLAAAICADLIRKLPNVHFWWHVDTQLRHWSIPALIADFGLEGHVRVTEPPMDDHTMAAYYRMCDLTILPSLGEGFGYSWLESVACGVSCLHVDYAGGASIMRTCDLEDCLVEPTCFRLDTQHDCYRPITEPWQWVEKVIFHLAQHDPNVRQPTGVGHLRWMKLAWPWRKWLREGLGNGQ